MDEFEADVLDVVRSARPAVDGVDGEAMARLRATILGEFSSPGGDNSPKFESPSGAPGPATRASQVVEDETGGEVLELVAVGGGRRPSRWRAVALVAAAAMVVAGLTTVAIARRSAPVGVGEGWTAPTADDFAPTSQYQVTRLVDGTTDVPFGERLTIGLLDPPPGAGVGCRDNLLPPGIGDGGAVVNDGWVVQWVPCHLVDPALIAFLDALMGAHPAVEVRGDELRLRAGVRELDAVRPTTVDPSALAWTTPSVEQLAGSTYAMHDQSHLVNGALGPVDPFDLTFDLNGFAVSMLGCGVASARATIAAGHLAVSAFTAGTNVAGYTPVGGRSCALDDLLSAIAKARPTIEVRADQLRLQEDGIDLQGTKTAGVNASALEVWSTPTIEELAGREFTATFVTDGDAVLPLAAFVSFTPTAVRFGNCGRSWIADAAVTDGKLVIGPPVMQQADPSGDCAAFSPDNLDALVGLVGAKPTIEVRGRRLRLTAGTTSAVAVQPGAVDPGSGPVVTPPIAPSPVDATTLPPVVTALTAPSAPHTPSIDELVGNGYVIDRLSIARDGGPAPTGRQ